MRAVRERFIEAIHYGSAIATKQPVPATNKSSGIDAAATFSANPRHKYKLTEYIANGNHFKQNT